MGQQQRSQQLLGADQMVIEHTSQASATGTAPTAGVAPAAEDAQQDTGEMIIEHTRLDDSQVNIQAGALVNQHGMADWEAVTDTMATTSADSDTSRGSGIELVAFDGPSHVGGDPGETPDEKDGPTPQEGSAAELALHSYAPDVSGLIEEDGQAIDTTLDAKEIALISGYGLANSGPIGAVTYWLHVYKQKKVLAKNLAQAENRYTEAEQKKRDSLAALGREVANLTLDDKDLANLIGAASMAQGELRSKQRRHSNLSQEHDTRRKPLEQQLTVLDEEMAPLKEQEAEVKKEYDALMVKTRHIETKKKRFQIDLRNMDELIGKRQEIFQNPETSNEGKDKAFQEINQFEARRPKLIEEVEICDKELAQLAGPISGVEAQLGDVRSKIKAKNDAIEIVMSKLKELADEFAKVEGAVAEEVQAESEKVENAWAAVGTKVLAQNLEFKELVEAREKTVTAILDAKQAKRQHALFVAAIESYDRTAIQTAKKTALLVLGAIIALIVLAVVFG